MASISHIGKCGYLCSLSVKLFDFKLFDLDKPSSKLLLNYDLVEFICRIPFYLLNLIQKNRTAEILREIATDKILIGWSIAAFVFDLMLERINCYSPKMKFLGLDSLEGLLLTQQELLPHYNKCIDKFYHFKEIYKSYEKQHIKKIIRLISDRLFIDNSKMNQKFSRYENNTVCIIDLIL